MDSKPAANMNPAPSPTKPHPTPNPHKRPRLTPEITITFTHAPTTPPLKIRKHNLTSHSPTIRQHRTDELQTGHLNFTEPSPDLPPLKIWLQYLKHPALDLGSQIALLGAQTPHSGPVPTDDDDNDPSAQLTTHLDLLSAAWITGRTYGDYRFQNAIMDLILREDLAGGGGVAGAVQRGAATWVDRPELAGSRLRFWYLHAIAATVGGGGEFDVEGTGWSVAFVKDLLQEIVGFHLVGKKGVGEGMGRWVPGWGDRELFHERGE
jgi:hypothetical protein